MSRVAEVRAHRSVGALKPHRLGDVLETAATVAAPEVRQLDTLARASEAERGHIPDVRRVRRHVQVQVAVIVVIPEPRGEAAHRRGHAQRGSHIREGAVGVVAIEPVRILQIRNVQVGESVGVVVAPRDRFGEAVVGDTRVRGDVGERAVPVVAEKLRRRRQRRARFVPHVEVQVTVVVEVGPPGGLGGEVFRAEAGVQCHIGKATAAEIAQQRVGVLPVVLKPRPARHKNIDVAIVVEVGLDHVQAAKQADKPRVLRTVGEGAVPVVFVVAHLARRVPRRDHEVEVVVVVEVVGNRASAQREHVQPRPAPPRLRIA